MINNLKVIAIIPARGGSKGVPRKNIRLMAGKPLIAWTIEEGKKSKFIDRLILSSDDLEIIRIAKEYGCDVPFVRPAELAQDDTPGIAPVLHALDLLPGYDIVVLLQPTSPLRTVQDIDQCITLLVNKRSPASVSVCEPGHHPFWMFTLDDQGRMEPFYKDGQIPVKRQDLPAMFTLNGAVYVARVEWLKNTKTFISPETIAYVMPRERSVDIDTELDFVVCEQIMLNRYSKL